MALKKYMRAFTHMHTYISTIFTYIYVYTTDHCIVYTYTCHTNWLRVMHFTGNMYKCAYFKVLMYTRTYIHIYVCIKIYIIFTQSATLYIHAQLNKYAAVPYYLS